MLFVVSSCFNRTILVLKWGEVGKNLRPRPRFNRTILVLKFGDLKKEMEKGGSFNRTILVLKYFDRHAGWL